MRISEIAAASGVGVETVRFYERKGLIGQPPRPQNGGYRDYPIEAAERIRFIRSAQHLGFSLSEVNELLALDDSRDKADCGDFRKHADIKRREVEEKIEGLQLIKAALDELIKACPGKGSTVRCSILGAIKNGTMVNARIAADATHTGQMNNGASNGRHKT